MTTLKKGKEKKKTQRQGVNHADATLNGRHSGRDGCVEASIILKKRERGKKEAARAGGFLLHFSLPKKRKTEVSLEEFRTSNTHNKKETSLLKKIVSHATSRDQLLFLQRANGSIKA